MGAIPTPWIQSGCIFDLRQSRVGVVGGLNTERDFRVFRHKYPFFQKHHQFGRVSCQNREDTWAGIPGRRLNHTTLVASGVLECGGGYLWVAGRRGAELELA